MMTAAQAVAAAIDFIEDEVTLEAAYDHVPSTKTAKLPDLVVELQEAYVTRNDADFPYSQLQQADLVIYRLACSFMVDNSDTAAAATQLLGFADTLMAAVAADPTLGQRVPLRSKFVSFEFTPPLVQYEDGTMGREMTMNLLIADAIDSA